MVINNANVSYCLINVYLLLELFVSRMIECVHSPLSRKYVLDIYTKRYYIVNCLFRVFSLIIPKHNNRIISLQRFRQSLYLKFVCLFVCVCGVFFFADFLTSSDFFFFVVS